MITALVYNIHKGFSPLGTKSILKQLKNMMDDLSPDLVLLQEVTGHLDEKHQVVELGNQFEFLADQNWPHYSYGKNAITTRGNHGNAILSKFPLTHWHNIDLTQHSLEQRGLLSCEVDIDQTPLHVLTTHLDLRQRNRFKQIQLIEEYIENQPWSSGPFILAGDFNDWNLQAHKYLQVRDFKEAISEFFGKSKATFPALFPLLSLDRFFYRGLAIEKVELISGRQWGKLSDHMALKVEFKISDD